MRKQKRQQRQCVHVASFATRLLHQRTCVETRAVRRQVSSRVQQQGINPRPTIRLFVCKKFLEGSGWIEMGDRSASQHFLSSIVAFAPDRPGNKQDKGLLCFCLMDANQRTVRHIWLNRNQKVFSNVVIQVNIHRRVLNTIDKAISQWRETPISPPPKHWLEMAMTLQTAIATTMTTRIERWLTRTLDKTHYSEGSSEAPHTTGAAIDADLSPSPF